MKKILFNDRYCLTEAVLEGRKTMTRRIIPPVEIEWNRRGKVTLPISGFHHGCLWMDCREFLPDSGLFDYPAPQKYQPAYSVGEEVAVAQAYKNDDVLTFNAYYADGQPRPDGHQRHKEMLESKGYSNKMFVRAEYMPHRIRITNIKVERLQDITDEDCLREGIFGCEGIYTFQGWCNKHGDTLCAETPREAFAALIDRISGKGTWEKNPWMYAYEFNLIK